MTSSLSLYKIAALSSMALTSSVYGEYSGPSKTFVHSQAPKTPATAGAGGAVGSRTHHNNNHGLTGRGFRNGNQPAETANMLMQTSPPADDVTACVKDTEALLLISEVKTATTVLIEDALRLDLSQSCTESTVTTNNAGGTMVRVHTCTLDMTGMADMLDVCSAHNGFYQEKDHAIICSPMMFASSSSTTTTHNQAEEFMAQEEGGYAGANGGSIIFQLADMPDCLGQTCSSSTPTAQILESKSVQRLANAIRQQLMMQPSSSSSSQNNRNQLVLPFDHNSSVRWTCHVDLEGTETHVGVMAHESFQQEMLAQKEQAVHEKVEHDEEGQGGTSAAFAVTTTRSTVINMAATMMASAFFVFMTI